MDLSKPLAFRMRPNTLEEYVGKNIFLEKIKYYIEQLKQIGFQALYCGDLLGVGKHHLQES